MPDEFKDQTVVQKPSNLMKSSSPCIKTARLCLSSSSRFSVFLGTPKHIEQHIRRQILNQKGLIFFFFFLNYHLTQACKQCNCLELKIKITAARTWRSALLCLTSIAYTKALFVCRIMESPVWMCWQSVRAAQPAVAGPDVLSCADDTTAWIHLYRWWKQEFGPSLYALIRAVLRLLLTTNISYFSVNVNVDVFTWTIYNILQAFWFVSS